MSEHTQAGSSSGMDLHRRRSVLVRMTETGEQLETVRISNDPEYLKAVMARAGEAPGGGARSHVRLVLGGGHPRRAGRHRAFGASAGGEDVLATGGSRTISVTPPIWPICCGWAGCPRRGSPHRRPGSCGSWVRHRAKLVGLRSGLKCQVHAVLAERGRQVPMSDLFGVAGQQLLDRDPAVGGVPGPGRLAAAADRPRSTSRSSCPPSWSPAGCAPTPATGDPADPRGRADAGRGVRRRDRRHHPLPPTRAAGLVGRADPETPRVRHHRAPRPDHQAGLPAGALGRGRGRATRRPAIPASGRLRDRVAARRGRNIGVVAAARELLTLVFYGLRDHHIRALHPPPPPHRGGVSSPARGGSRVVQVMTPDCNRRGRPL